MNLTAKELVRFIFDLFSHKSGKTSEELIEKFERSFAERYKLQRSLAVSKARVALFLLLKNLALKKGGEVIISALHVADFVNMICLAGFIPVVVDLKDDRYCIDYDDLERKINAKTSLFIVTHLSGYATNMDRIERISKKFQVPFIEDCSQAFESYYKGKRLGTFGIASIFSMSLLKPVCTLSGGMILLKDKKLLETLREQVRLFRSPSKILLVLEVIKNIILKMATAKLVFNWLTFPVLISATKLGDLFSWYQKVNKTVMLRKEIPRNFLTPLSWQQAKMGLSQLNTLEKREQTRIEAGKYLYRNLISNKVVRIPKCEEHGGNSFWLFPVIAEDSIGLKRFLSHRGIDSSGTLLSCLPDEPAFANFQFNSPNARALKQSTLFLPMYWRISQKELDQIVDVVAMYQEHCKGKI